MSALHFDVAAAAALVITITTAVIGYVIETVSKKLGRWALRAMARRFA